MKAIIAAGGSGTRLRPLTFSSNKHLLPVANKPLLLYPFEAILETGIKEIGIIVNQTRPAIESLLGDGSNWGVKVSYIDQPQALGLAHVVKISQQFLDGQPFIYHLGDNIFTEGIMRPFRHFTSTKPDALLTMVQHEENYRLGVPYFDKDGNLEKVVEKPSDPPHKFAVPGLYFFNHNVFKAFEGSEAIKPSQRGELEITDLYSYLISHGYTVETEEVDGTWMDPGKFDDMLVANAHILNTIQDSRVLGTVDDYSKISGKVVIGKNSSVTSSEIVGPVIIGDNVELVDAKIGPHVSIDNNCIIKGTSISNSVIMQDSEISSVAHPLTNSLIGKKTKVWEEKAASINLFIGDHCNVRLN